MVKDRILVLSVDRDNDVGEKTKIKGPVIGNEAVIKTAVALGRADPSDSDLNALFQSVRVYDDIKKDYTAEVAVITGKRDVGIASDKEITTQLEKVLRGFKANYVILVTDGSEDEHVMPIIQSRVPILSVDRVIVKQSERLESTYYKIKDFLEETMENPKYTRLFFGLPAIALLIYALFVGAFLFVKGFRLDKYIISGLNELSTSLTRRRFAFFTYIVGIALFILASVRGYDAAIQWINIGVFETAASFVLSSIYFFYLGGIIAWIGHSMSSVKRSGKTVVSVTIFGFAVSFVIFNAANIILNPNISMFNFVLSILIGFALIFAALAIELKK
jgi:putative membrane protein